VRISATALVALPSVVIVLAVCIASAHAGTITISESEFREELSDEVPVSGEVRVGVLAGTRKGPSATRPLKLVVDLPAERGRRLCVKLTSRDGRYRAEGSAELPSALVGATDVELPTHHAGTLSAKADELYLAPFVTLSDDPRCRGRVAQILPARWGDGAPGDALMVLINSGGLASRLVFTAADGRRSVDCRPLPERQLVAFDTICELAPTPGAHAFSIERQEFGDVVRVPLPLVLPVRTTP